MPEFLRKICNHISENSPFNGGGVGEIFFKPKRKEENCSQCSPTNWGHPEKSSKSRSIKTSSSISIPTDAVPDGPIRLVYPG